MALAEGRRAHFLKRTDAGVPVITTPAYAQLALGLLNRMAPQLSIFVIGFLYPHRRHYADGRANTVVRRFANIYSAKFSICLLILARFDK